MNHTSTNLPSTKIGDLFVGPGYRAKIVTVAHGRHYASYARAARKERADILELRLDTLFMSDQQLESVVRNCRQAIERCKIESGGMPLIGTIRLEDQMGQYRCLSGRFADVEEKRLKIFSSVMDLVDCVDIELLAKEILRKVIQAAKKLEKSVIVSYHNSLLTPSDEKLESLIADCASYGPDVVKFGVRVAENSDVERLLSFCERHSKDYVLSVLGLGAGSEPLRTLNIVYGASLTYGHVKRPVVEGSLSVREIRSRLQERLPTIWSKAQNQEMFV